MTTATNYAQVEDVRRILGLEFQFSSQTRPTDDDVAQFILEAEAEVDKTTNDTWITATATEEYYDLPNDRNVDRTSTEIYLKHNPVRTLDTAQGDKLEIWDGSQYVDWTTEKTESRSGDYWLDYNKGVLYIVNYWPYDRTRVVRVTYRYGQTSVPNDITQATALIAAALLITSDDHSVIIDDTGEAQNVDYATRVRQWRGHAARILDKHAAPYLVY